MYGFVEPSTYKAEEAEEEEEVVDHFKDTRDKTSLLDQRISAAVKHQCWALSLYAVPGPQPKHTNSSINLVVHYNCLQAKGEDWTKEKNQYEKVSTRNAIQSLRDCRV